MIVYLVNAFTYGGKGGNEAGVVPCKDFPSTETMQRAAKQIGFSETVFIRPLRKGFASRFFTPECEVPVCGHATLAAFFLLASQGRIRGSRGRVLTWQDTGDGRLPVCIDFYGHRADKVFMQQSCPRSLGMVEGEDLTELYNCLGLDRACVGIVEHGEALPEIISTGLPDIIVPVKTGKALDRIKPDFHRLAELSRRLGVVGTHVFTTDTGDGRFTVRCRNFGPAVGINEEAATGTSNGALGYYMYKRGILKNGEMVSGQGFGMGKPSAIYVKVGQEAIMVGGEAVVAGEKEVDD
jgi:PhzF family phenazine biosynthesis protein